MHTTSGIGLTVRGTAPGRGQQAADVAAAGALGPVHRAFGLWRTRDGVPSGPAPGAAADQPSGGAEVHLLRPARIRHKPARLRGDDVPGLLALLVERFAVDPACCMLHAGLDDVVTRLALGGDPAGTLEPHQSRRGGLVYTGAKAEYTLPLTAQACALLRRYQRLQTVRATAARCCSRAATAHR